MRVRTVFTFVTGAGLGAAAVYLLDPEQGQSRRRDVRRDAFRRAREGAVVVVRGGAELTKEVVGAAAQGYQQARDDAEASQPFT